MVALPKGSALKNGVFNILENHAVERRQKLEAQRASALISDDEILLQSRKKWGVEDDGVLATAQMLIRRRIMGLKRIRRTRQRTLRSLRLLWKVAAKIDDSDLTSFFSGILLISIMKLLMLTLKLLIATKINQHKESVACLEKSVNLFWILEGLICLPDISRVIHCIKYDGMPSREWENGSLGEASCCWKYLAKCKRGSRPPEISCTIHAYRENYVSQMKQTYSMKKVR